jgi:hypothetical protein
VAHYRIYPLKADGRLDGPPVELEADTDAAAIDAARQTIRTCPAEIWQGERCVGIINWEHGTEL